MQSSAEGRLQIARCHVVSSAQQTTRLTKKVSSFGAERANVCSNLKNITALCDVIVCRFLLATETHSLTCLRNSWGSKFLRWRQNSCWQGGRTEMYRDSFYNAPARSDLNVNHAFMQHLANAHDSLSQSKVSFSRHVAKPFILSTREVPTSISKDKKLEKWEKASIFKFQVILIGISSVGVHARPETVLLAYVCPTVVTCFVSQSIWFFVYFPFSTSKY